MSDSQTVSDPPPAPLRPANRASALKEITERADTVSDPDIQAYPVRVAW